MNGDNNGVFVNVHMLSQSSSLPLKTSGLPCAQNYSSSNDEREEPAPAVQLCLNK